MRISAPRSAAKRVRRLLLIKRLGLTVVPLLLLLLLPGSTLFGCANRGDNEKDRSAESIAVQHSNGPTATNTPILPLPLPKGQPLTVHNRPIPILMYHVIADPPPTAAYPDLYVSGPVFAQQMKALAQRGYQAVTLDQVHAYWRKGVRLPAKPIVLTFDDGYHSVYSRAFPVLKKLRWAGVVNLEVNNLTVSGGLTHKNTKKLLAHGWELAAHTETHPDLTTVDAVRLRKEVAGARTLLQKRFGVPVNFFCYPSGRYNDTVVEAVRSAGYLGATTTEPGLGKHNAPYTLSRVRVNGSEGVEGLLAKL